MRASFMIAACAVLLAGTALAQESAPASSSSVSRLREMRSTYMTFDTYDCHFFLQAASAPAESSSAAPGAASSVSRGTFTRISSKGP
jgi:hypothetical protein